MKILFIAATDIKGGGGRATFTLFNGLRAEGCDVQMLVQRKFTDDHRITQAFSTFSARFRSHAVNLPANLYFKRGNSMSFKSSYLPTFINKQIEKINPDLVHIHWISDGVITVDEVSLIKQPVVMTIHDMWTFTGGCYAAIGCEKYKVKCGSCPALASTSEKDLSYYNWKSKLKAFKKKEIVFVAPSTKMKQQAQESSILNGKEITVIGNPVNVNIFYPYDKMECRKKFKLPADKKLVLLGGARGLRHLEKGGNYAIEALQKLYEKLPGDVEIVMFGNQDILADSLPFKIHFMGYFSDDSELAKLYTTGDVLLFPSIQESFGLTPLESMACGTPVVGFNGISTSDFIIHGINGMLAEFLDAGSLSENMYELLQNNELRKEMGINARKTAIQNFSPEVISAKTISLYRKLIGF
jgi:glycosyltransferase involved in cell wall biosynthesis